MGAAEFDALVETTFRIRHTATWAEARRALQEAGIDPGRAICTSFSGWGFNGCSFVLPDGRFVHINVLLGWDGQCFIPLEDIEEDIPLDPCEKLARSILTGGDTRAFDTAVLERYQQEFAASEAVGGAGGV